MQIAVYRKDRAILIFIWAALTGGVIRAGISLRSMEKFVEILFDIDFLKWAIPLLGGVFAWLFNERRKRAWEEYVRKENNYKELLRTYGGFYTDSPDFDMQAEFLH